ncbi:glutathione hydrolase-like YwrD proenzyme isoform X2 [Stigmatopora nigra]
MDTDLSFSSRRSPVVCLHGCVASSQTLASAVGLDVLKRGGNAADAAVAVAAALAVTEPCSTGLGGDAFCLFFNSSTGEIKGINGSGRSPKGLTLEYLKGRMYSANDPPPVFDALNVTVPGAPACWCDTIEMFGSHKLALQEVLNGAVELAEVGFPVAEVTAHHWKQWVGKLRDAGRELDGALLIDNEPPKHGQLFRNPALAQTLKELGQHGKAAFYQGRVAQAITDIIIQHGGVMTLDDLRSHDSDVVTPISTKYKGVCLWECPPNSQGLAALLLLNILENFPLKASGHNSADYIHIFVEAVRLALTDAHSFVCDPDHVAIPLESLLKKDFSSQRAQLINMNRYSSNRGANFSLDHNSRNCVAGGKRPYHTIIPALLTNCATKSEKLQLLASLGVMGGMMQPQGHVQVLCNMLEFGMNPQQALDSPRVYVEYDLKEKQWSVNLEEGIQQEVAETLRKCGHKVNWPVTGHKRSQFGRGQIITVGDWWNSSVNHNDYPSKVLWAGSDPRSDGCAMGF